ncbi:MAG: hypothetical protein SFV81_30825 [Pirellulaceae bacterium]|nr:hypothetical protein [Pirellulaceae bacterium]
MSAKSLCKLSTSVLVGLITITLQAGKQLDPLDQFQANEVVNSLKIELSVSANGENLDEPIALDLGLGFPFWLHKLGRVATGNAPFGAVCQTGSDSHEIRAGERAVFEFLKEGDVGLDSFFSSPQLLSELHVSDIERIGFCSKADHGWSIDGYTLTINGKVFATKNRLDANGRLLQDTARERLAEISNELSSSEQELSELSGLIATQLATEADSQRFQELTSVALPKLAEQRRLQRQLQGVSPFWSDATFDSPWRGKNLIQQVKVTLLTAPHSEAETNNFVYFGVGGHKYLLGSPMTPLSPDQGSQEFVLDLATAPLIAGDLRGFSIGMLAVPENASDVADRWHPQRMRVEVDERIVYDSEDNALDRLSLSAVRIIPPAMTNLQHQVVSVHPTSREVAAWTPGCGAGLDLIHGGPAQLPALGDPAFPLPENPLVDWQQQDVTSESPVGDSLPYDPSTQEVLSQENWYDPFAGPFPGEYSYGSSWEPRFGHRLRRLFQGLLGLGGAGAGWLPSWGTAWDPGWGPGWNSGPNWNMGASWNSSPGLIEQLLLGLLGLQQGLPHWVLPQPVGSPPQLGAVQLDLGSGLVTWTVTGDSSEVDHYAVDLVKLLPDNDIPWATTCSETLEVAAGVHAVSLSEFVPLATVETDDTVSRSYATVRVRMVPNDASVGVQQGLSPALPRRVMSPAKSVHLATQYTYLPAGGGAMLNDVSLAGEPGIPGPAVWVASEVATHTGLIFANVSPLQHHIVARAVHDGDVIQVKLTSGAIEPGNYRLIAYVGFHGGVQAQAEANVSSALVVTSVLDPTKHIGYPATAHVAAPTFPMTPLAPLVTDFHTADVNVGAMTLELTYRFNQLHVDPQHPPMVVGVRLLSM